MPTINPERLLETLQHPQNLWCHGIRCGAAVVFSGRYGCPPLVVRADDCRRTRSTY